ARHAYTSDDRVDFDVTEYRIELPIHESSSKWRTGTSYVFVGIFQLAFVVHHFSEPIRRLSRIGHPASRREIRDRIRGVGIRRLPSSPFVMALCSAPRAP